MAAVTSVEEYFQRHEKWEKELSRLREIILSQNLIETIKWGGPVYCLDGKNVCSIAAFKNHYAVWFFQGILLEDPNGALFSSGEDKSKSLRQLRFEQNSEIDLEQISKFVQQAIDIVNLGVKIKPKSKRLQIPTELENRLGENEGLNAKFYDLSPGKQREYAEYVSSAKREETRNLRLEKIIPLILQGKGLNDKYRK